MNNIEKWLLTKPERPSFVRRHRIHEGRLKRIKTETVNTQTSRNSESNKNNSLTTCSKPQIKHN